MSKRHRRRRGRPRARDSGGPVERLPYPWVECGGELYLALDFTPAGLPIGLRAEELDAAIGASIADRSQSPRAREGGSPQNPF